MSTDITGSSDLLDAMRTSDSDAMDFAVNRDDKQPGVTFSADALGQTVDSIALFIGTRIEKRFARGEDAPTQMVVSVRVQLDGQSIYVADEMYPWYVVNGPARLTDEDRTLLAFQRLDHDARLRVLMRVRRNIEGSVEDLDRTIKMMDRDIGSRRVVDAEGSQR